jgi:hypothetical protein
MSVLAQEMTTEQWISLVGAAALAVGQGKAGDIGAPGWADEVADVARTLARVAIVESTRPIEMERQWVGRVVQVDDPARSTRGANKGRALNLAKITFDSPSCEAYDTAWVSRTDPEGQQIIERAKALLGAGPVRYTKRHVVQMEKGVPVRDASGALQTRSYLVAIDEIADEGESETHGTQAGEAREAEVGEGRAEVASGVDSPRTGSELLLMAAEIGVAADDVKRLMARLCGPPDGRPRTESEVARVWAALNAEQAVAI